MRKIIGAILIALLITTLCFAQEKESKAKIEKCGTPRADFEFKCNLVMRNIFNGILKIKDKYKELDKFGEKAYQKNREIRYDKSKYKYEGQNKPNYTSQLSFVIMPTQWPYPPQPSFPPLDRSEPDREIYIKEVGLYLDIYITSDNYELKNELMKIIETNAVPR